MTLKKHFNLRRLIIRRCNNETSQPKEKQKNEKEKHVRGKNEVFPTQRSLSPPSFSLSLSQEERGESRLFPCEGNTRKSTQHKGTQENCPLALLFFGTSKKAFSLTTKYFSIDPDIHATKEEQRETKRLLLRRKKLPFILQRQIRFNRNGKKSSRKMFRTSEKNKNAQKTKEIYSYDFEFYLLLLLLYEYESARPKYDRVVAFFEHTKRRKKSFYPVSPVRTHKVTHKKRES